MWHVIMPPASKAPKAHTSISITQPLQPSPHSATESGERDGERGERRSRGESEGTRENETSRAAVCQDLEPQSPQWQLDDEGS